MLLTTLLTALVVVDLEVVLVATVARVEVAGMRLIRSVTTASESSTLR